MLSFTAFDKYMVRLLNILTRSELFVLGLGNVTISPTIMPIYLARYSTSVKFGKYPQIFT